jgi:hypothetical protein
MSDYEEVTVLNQGLRSRTSASGKTTFSVVIKSEPIVVNTGPAALMQPIAQAVAHHLRERMSGITETASKATLKARAAAQRAMQAGAAWATKRYAGGRIGSMPPNTSDRKFNDSGRFVKGLVAAYAGKDGTFRINVPANRLDPSTTSDGQAGVERIWKELVRLVPEFGDPSMLMQNDVIKATVKRASNEMIKIARARTDELQVSAARALFSIVKQAIGIVAG